MIHKKFYEILSFAEKNGLDCGLITNGSAITKEHSSELVENLQWIRVSINGGDAASYNKVQGKEHFERVVSNISMLAKEKIKKNNPTRSNTLSKITVPITSYLEILLFFSK